MTIFYVYLKWDRSSNGSSAERGRYLLTCESRYVADELFRGLQMATAQDRELHFTCLNRRTPQMWFFDSNGDYPWLSIATVLREKHFMTEFGSKVMFQTLPLALGNSGNEWPIIPASEGPDWVHDGVYYIRNKRQPGLYWYCSGGDIQVSDTHMTKFRIHGVESQEGERMVLIRSDRVAIYPVEHNPDNKCIGKQPGNNSLVVSETPSSWEFGDLLGSFKRNWRGAKLSYQYLTWTGDGGGDEWELC